MLKYMRRASTSVPRSLLALPNPTHANAFFLSRVSQPSKRRLVASSLSRGLPSLPRWSRDTKQYHGIQAQEEEPYNDEASGNRDEASRRSRFSGENPKAPQDAVFTKFAQLGENGMVCNAVVSAITTDMGLETMTLVQSMTISEALKGGDVLAQARTGTGKTLAFLLPVLQNIISKDPSLEKRSYSRRTQGPDIRAIIISPTRELAEQIAVEASKVVKHTGLVVQVAVGGNSKQLGLRKIRNEGCHILVGTPGRLNDILKDPYSGVRAPELSAFVLDEADRLLDQGFLPEIESIQKLLPDRREVDRQTLMFSATVPREVLGVVGKTMKPNYHFVQTVQPGEADTHLKVPQKMVHVAGMENLMPALLELCKREIARKDTPLPFKAIVFFGANSEVKLAAAIFNNLGRDGNDRLTGHPLHPMKMFEIHSKLSQPQRTYCADAFRRASTGILFSSDVTARGMDFPNVTHVIQIGLPTSRDVYIHRLGRTARGDKAGEGVLFLTPPEVNEARQRLRKLPLERDESYATAIIDMTRDAELPLVVAETLTQVISATKGVPEHMKSAAYMATLGHFSWMQPKQNLLNMMNNRSKFAWGLEIPPAISPMLARKLGLAHLSGINIGTPLYSDDAGSRGGFGGRGGRGDFGGRGERAIGGGRGDSPRGNPWEHRGRIDPNGGSSYGERRGGSFGDRGRSSSYGERRGGSYSDRGASSSYGDRSGTSSYGESSGGSYSGRGGNSFSRGGRGGGRGGSFGTRDDGRSSRRSASDRTGGSLAQLYEGGDGESRGYSAKRESRSSY